MQGGDGLGGLAAMIMVATLCIAIVPAIVLGTIGYFVGRPRAGTVGAIAGTALGLGLGVLASIATFYESVWDPPMSLDLEVPAGFAHDSVVLIQDPAVTNEIAWSGADLPFTAREGRIRVPASGVARVRQLGQLNGDVEARLSIGTHSDGSISRNVAGLGQMEVYFFGGDWSEQEPLDQEDESAVAAHVLARERAR